MKKIINFKLIGGILIIVGNSIGGGMLALPVSNAAVGFVYSNVFLFLCWAIMMLSGLFILEINLWLPKDSNLISMVEKTLGFPGKMITWVIYLFLLYALLCAYISGSSDIFQGLFQTIHIQISQTFSAVSFVILFGMIVYLGVQSVDRVNRILMLGKLGIYLFLVLLLVPHMQTSNLHSGHIQYATSDLIMVVLVAFGFANVVPSLRSYFGDDVFALRTVIIIGSLIPLGCYIAWNGVIMGVVPAQGTDGLLNLYHSAHPNTGLTSSLTAIIQNHKLSQFFRYFTSICMLTSFLCVSLSLFDFLADGLKLSKQGRSKWIVTGLTFLPPLAIVLFYPAVFIKALTYAGMSIVLLLLVFPTLMIWRGRYIMKIAHTHHYQVIGGKVMVILFGMASFGLLMMAIKSFF